MLWLLLETTHRFSPSISARHTAVRVCHTTVNHPLKLTHNPQSLCHHTSAHRRHFMKWRTYPRNSQTQFRATSFSFVTWYITRPLSTSWTLCEVGGDKRRSRLVNPRTKQDKKKVREKEIQVIDESGRNLGEMRAEVAIQISKGQGLEMVQVRKEMGESKAVYKFVTRKQLYKEKKLEKQRNKKDPQQVVKEVSVSTNIESHDLEVKMHKIKQFLEKKHTVRVFIEGTFRKYFSEAEVASERKRQVSLLSNVSRMLEGVGSKVSKEGQQGRKLVCSFKPTSVSLQDHD